MVILGLVVRAASVAALTRDFLALKEHGSGGELLLCRSGHRDVLQPVPCR
jgi:hypothetical protein